MIYLDNASTTFPKPTEVYEEVIRCMEGYAANPGRGSYDMVVKAGLKISETREMLSAFFNIRNPSRIIFTSNATEALNLGIKGTLKSGDHVISTIIEHNSVLRPLNYLSRNGVALTLVGVNELGYASARSIRKEIKHNTKLIVMNHASNVLGTIQHIGEIGRIAREAGVKFMVDASQSAGVISIDVEKDNIDMLAFSGHKGLFGPQGTGALYVRDGIELRELKQGATGSNCKLVTQPSSFPDRYESGTMNTPGIAGLCEGMKFINRVGRRNIQKHEELLVEYLLKELSELSYVKIYGSKSPLNRNAVVSMNIEGIDCTFAGNFFNSKGIAVRTGCHSAPLIHGMIGTYASGTIRISPGYFNTYDDMDAFIEATRQLKKQHDGSFGP